MDQRKTYTTPTIRLYGDIREITQTSANRGAVTDGRDRKTA
jgi:hypothetical protein